MLPGFPFHHCPHTAAACHYKYLIRKKIVWVLVIFLVKVQKLELRLNEKANQAQDKILVWDVIVSGRMNQHLK